MTPTKKSKEVSERPVHEGLVRLRQMIRKKKYGQQKFFAHLVAEMQELRNTNHALVMSVASLNAVRTIEAYKSQDEGPKDNKEDGDEVHDDGTNRKKDDGIEAVEQEQQVVSAAPAVSHITVNSVNTVIVKQHTMSPLRCFICAHG